MQGIMQKLYDNGFKGPIRPDHVPTMYGDKSGFPGYTNLGSLFAIGYIRGLMDDVSTIIKKLNTKQD